jgi:hypothetical protein
MNNTTTNNTVIPVCNNTSVLEKCEAQYYAYNNKTATLSAGFYSNCIQKDACTTELEPGFNEVCPDAIKLYDCYGAEIDCLYSNNLDELNRFKSGCNYTTNSTNTTVNLPNEGFTFMMPWSLLLVFFV